MNAAEAIALLRRGRCTAAKLGEAGCETCERTDEAMRALVAEGARRGATWAADEAERWDLDAAICIRDKHDADEIAREVLP